LPCPVTVPPYSATSSAGSICCARNAGAMVAMGCTVSLRSVAAFLRPKKVPFGGKGAG
jgi:hypothetical protein